VILHKTFTDDILEAAGVNMDDFKPICIYCNFPVIWGQEMEQEGDKYSHRECYRKIDHKWYRPGEEKPHE